LMTMARHSTAHSQVQGQLPPGGDQTSKNIPKIDRDRFSHLRRLVWLFVALGIVLFVLFTTWIGWGAIDSPAQLIDRAEAASRSSNWALALRYWRMVNATKAARSTTYLQEARACLALSKAAQAERSLRAAIADDVSDPEPWRLLLEILRVEDRIVEAQRLGWEGYDQVEASGRSTLLRELTLALLAELPDELVRSTLRRWVAADQTDIDARVALLQRIAAQPRAADPDRPSLLAALETILLEHPDHVGAREALVSALADSGELDRGRDILAAWPQSSHDARYWRLRGRWELEYDHRADQAVAALRTALVELPHDWRSWYRLARALHTLRPGRESTEAALTTSRIREVLDPLTLGPRLDSSFDQIDNPAACAQLALICERAGLNRLATAWRAQAGVRGQPSASPNP
jgi:tetratricopeptide (TPR) repeat protein